MFCILDLCKEARNGVQLFEEPAVWCRSTFLLDDGTTEENESVCPVHVKERKIQVQVANIEVLLLSDNNFISEWVGVVGNSCNRMWH